MDDLLFLAALGACLAKSTLLKSLPCEACGTMFDPRRRGQKFCGKGCATLTGVHRHRARQRELNHDRAELIRQLGCLPKKEAKRAVEILQRAYVHIVVKEDLDQAALDLINSTKLDILDAYHAKHGHPLGDYAW